MGSITGTAKVRGAHIISIRTSLLSYWREYVSNRMGEGVWISDAGEKYSTMSEEGKESTEKISEDDTEARDEEIEADVTIRKTEAESGTGPGRSSGADSKPGDAASSPYEGGGDPSQTHLIPPQWKHRYG